MTWFVIDYSHIAFHTCFLLCDSFEGKICSLTFVEFVPRTMVFARLAKQPRREIERTSFLMRLAFPHSGVAGKGRVEAGFGKAKGHAGGRDSS